MSWENLDLVRSIFATGNRGTSVRRRGRIPTSSSRCPTVQ